jgi:TRAP-type mannitol/chloroaromatic compound transport system substrate-binding protein
MTKKYFTFTLLCALILLSGTSIHSKNQEQNEPKYNWKLVSVYNRHLPIQQNGLDKFVNDIRDISKGQLDIKVYTAEEYNNIDPFDVFDAVSNGVVEMGFGTSTYWSKKNKIPGSAFMYAVPFGLSAKDMYAWLYRGKGLEIWREMYGKFEVIPFPIWDTGGAMGGWFKNEIKGIDDFTGMKIRSFGHEAEVYRKLGAIPNWIDATKVLNSYNTGDIAAFVCLGPYTDQYLKFYRGPKYYYYPGWQEPCGVISIIINRKAWDELGRENEHLQRTIETVCGNTYQYITNQYNTVNSRALPELQKEGVMLRKFPQPVLDKFREYSKELLEEMAKNNPQFDKIYQSFKKFKEENVESGWGRIVDEAVYNETTASKFIDGLANSMIAKAYQDANNRVVISLSGDVSFNSGSANPKPALSAVIASIAEIIKDYSISIKLIKVEGHTDSQGKPCTNWLLSKDRATAVVKLLTDEGVSKSLIKTAFYGDAFPIADNNKSEGRELNRRVEIIIEF